MEQKKRFISSRTMILLIGAFLLCAIGLTGAIGATQAQLSVSKNYEARIQQTELGVAILEKSGNGEKAVAVNVGDEGSHVGTVSADESIKTTLLSQVDADGNQLVLMGDAQMIPGKKYTEEISAQNVSATSGEYVRMIIRKYWTIDGEKAYNIDPALIRLEPTEDHDGWIFAENESNDEELVFYFKDELLPGNATPAVIKSICLDRQINQSKNELATQLKSSNDSDQLDAEMLVSQLQIKLEAEVEAVQTKHVVEAAMSAWGVDVKPYWGEGA